MPVAAIASSFGVNEKTIRRQIAAEGIEPEGKVLDSQGRERSEDRGFVGTIGHNVQQSKPTQRDTPPEPKPTVKGTELKQLKDELAGQGTDVHDVSQLVGTRTASLTLFTRRTLLNVGMLLRDSEVGLAPHK